MGELLTSRLRLHPVTAEEARATTAGMPSGQLGWAAGYPSADDIMALSGFVEHCTWAGDPRPFGQYQLVRRADDLVIGGLGFRGPPDEDGSVRIGYGIVPAARCQGYATEALIALLVLARDRGARLVLGHAERANIPSQTVMERAGMRLVADDHAGLHYEIAW